MAGRLDGDAVKAKPFYSITHWYANIEAEDRFRHVSHEQIYSPRLLVSGYVKTYSIQTGPVCSSFICLQISFSQSVLPSVWLPHDPGTAVERL